VVKFSVAPDRIEKRANFFKNMATRFAAGEAVQKAGIVFNPLHALTLAEAYYLLSESYRSYRMETDHRTATPKIAALTCAAICAVNPLRPPKADFENLDVRYANPMFAMRCAISIVTHPYHLRAFEERRRILDELAITHFPCLDPYLADVACGQKKPLDDYNMKLDKFSVGISMDEITRIESYVSRFTVFQDQKIFAAPSASASTPSIGEKPNE
jgi:hypothetical protein